MNATNVTKWFQDTVKLLWLNSHALDNIIAWWSWNLNDWLKHGGPNMDYITTWGVQVVQNEKDMDGETKTESNYLRKYILS